MLSIICGTVPDSPFARVSYGRTVPLGYAANLKVGLAYYAAQFLAAGATQAFDLLPDFLIRVYYVRNFRNRILTENYAAIVLCRKSVEHVGR